MYSNTYVHIKLERRLCIVYVALALTAQMTRQSHLYTHSASAVGSGYSLELEISASDVVDTRLLLPLSCPVLCTQQAQHPAAPGRH
jgi:hypothetical protein